MIAIDTNILVYAHREDSPFHRIAKACVSDLANGPRTWAIPWPCLHEFLAVLTNPRVYKPVTQMGIALGQAERLIELPNTVLIGETDEHWQRLRDCIDASIIGRRIHDAKIAAICLQHGVREFWSADRDFSRFPQLKTRNPLAG